MSKDLVGAKKEPGWKLPQFPLWLAPMVGLSHHPLRAVIKKYMPLEADMVWPTEMLSSWKLPKQSHGQSLEVYWPKTWPHLSPQLLGNELSPLAESIALLKDWGAFSVDINMGCPVSKALKHNYGVALMGDPQYASQVVKRAVEASDLPVSVKLRAGFRDDFGFLKDFAQGLQEGGASWIALHPRRAEEKRRGEADWSLIEKLIPHLKIPIVGNGDIQTWKCAWSKWKQSGCFAVMSGRALAARPWMVWQLAEEMGWRTSDGLGSAPRSPEEEALEYKKVCETLLDEFSDCEPNQTLLVRKFLFYIKTTHVWLDFGHDLYAKISSCKNIESCRTVIDEFFAPSLRQRMSPFTHLLQ